MDTETVDTDDRFFRSNLLFHQALEQPTCCAFVLMNDSILYRQYYYKT